MTNRGQPVSGIFSVAFGCCIWMVISLLSTPALGQTCGSPHFGSKDEIGSTLRRSTEALTRAISKIESVPPADAEYIERESQSALRQNSQERYRLVLSNRFYHPHQIHKHFKIAADNLVAAQNATTNADRVVYLSVVLSRFSDLSVALSDYQDFDLKRKSILSQADRQDLAFTMEAQKYFILEGLQCSARQMRDR
jgi:hypothetical protein